MINCNKTGERQTVSLINFHYAHNYGAVLQCLALQDILRKQGRDVQVIDYRPYYQQQYYLPYPNPLRSAYWRFRLNWSQPMLKRLYLSARWAAILVYGYKNASKRKQLHKAFAPFVQKHLTLTQRYNTLKALRKSPPITDAYVCGSDQLWNPSVTSGLDPAYFLDFGRADVRRIAYAVSPGKALDCSYFQVELKRYLKSFRVVSLRESEKKNALESLCSHNISINLDPTLLLQKEDYQEYEEAISDTGKYILVYAFKEADGNTVINKALRAVAEKVQYPIIDISLEDIHWHTEVKTRTAVTPGQFLTYFRNAAYVVTNSFHGTAFSIVYEREFLSIAKTGTEGRMVELLKKLDLEDNLITANDEICVPQSIDYTRVALNLSPLRDSGRMFLKNALLEQE